MTRMAIRELSGVPEIFLYFNLGDGFMSVCTCKNRLTYMINICTPSSM